MSLKLLELNSRAAAELKAGDPARALGVWRALFRKARAQNLTHPEMHTVVGNACAAALQCELWQEALDLARRGRELAEGALRRNGRASPAWVRSFGREGAALLGLGRTREAVAALERGLEADPLDPALRQSLEQARQRLAEEILQGEAEVERVIDRECWDTYVVNMLLFLPCPAFWCCRSE